MTPTPDELPTDAVPGLAEYSAAEQGRRFALPAGFADAITASALHARTRRIQRQWAVGLSLAASALLAVGLFFGGAFTSPRLPEVVEGPTGNPPTPVERTPPPANVREQLAFAGEALESLTRQTTDKALAPTRVLIDSAVQVTLPPPRKASHNDPAPALTALPNAARTGLTPVTSTPRRAVFRLLKDVGLAAN